MISTLLKNNLLQTQPGELNHLLGQYIREGRSQLMSALIAVILLVVPQFSWARTDRHLWIPQATINWPVVEGRSPAELMSRQCRAEAEERFAIERSKSESAGRWAQYNVGLSCEAARAEHWNFEWGVDLNESGEKSLSSTLGLFQVSARVTYAEKENKMVALENQNGLKSVLAFDQFGFDAGRSDYNMVSSVVQYREGVWEAGGGLLIGSPSLLVDPDGEVAAASLLAGVWKYWHRGVWALEWVSGRNFLGGYALGGKFNFSDHFAASVGLLVANDRNARHDQLFIRLTVW